MSNFVSNRLAERPGLPMAEATIQTFGIDSKVFCSASASQKATISVRYRDDPSLHASS
jgi:hypothetical protein